MSIRVLLRDHPHRAIALATEDHALVFRHSPFTLTSGHVSSSTSLTSQTSPAQSVPRCMVEFSEISLLDLDGYRPLGLNGVHGTLGLVTLENDVFLCVITGSSQAATVRPGETVQRIHSVEFCGLPAIIGKNFQPLTTSRLLKQSRL